MEDGTSSLRVLCWRWDVSLVLHWGGPSVQPYTPHFGICCQPYKLTCFSSELQLCPGCLHTYVCFPCLGPICKLRDYRLFFQSPFFFFFPFYVAGHEVKVFFVCFRGAFSTISEGRQKRRYLRRSAFAVTTAPSCGTAAAPDFGRESPASPGARPGRPREVCGVRWVRRAARCPGSSL